MILVVNIEDHEIDINVNIPQKDFYVQDSLLKPPLTPKTLNRNISTHYKWHILNLIDADENVCELLDEIAIASKKGIAYIVCQYNVLYSGDIIKDIVEKRLENEN